MCASCWSRCSHCEPRSCEALIASPSTTLCGLVPHRHSQNSQRHGSPEGRPQRSASLRRAGRDWLLEVAGTHRVQAMVVARHAAGVYSRHRARMADPHLYAGDHFRAPDHVLVLCVPIHDSAPRSAWVYENCMPRLLASCCHRCGVTTLLSHPDTLQQQRSHDTRLIACRARCCTHGDDVHLTVRRRCSGACGSCRRPTAVSSTSHTGRCTGGTCMV